MFLGFSSEHSSLVPLVLNIRTGKITPCYHAIFDDAFSTVVSLTSDTDIDTAWENVLSLTREHYIEFDDYLIIVIGSPLYMLDRPYNRGIPLLKGSPVP